LNCAIVYVIVSVISERGKALARAQKAIVSADKYIGSLFTETIPHTKSIRIYDMHIINRYVIHTTCISIHIKPEFCYRARICGFSKLESVVDVEL
jgi:hypothetical protein